MLEQFFTFLSKSQLFSLVQLNLLNVDEISIVSNQNNDRLVLFTQSRIREFALPLKAVDSNESLYWNETENFCFARDGTFSEHPTNDMWMK